MKINMNLQIGGLAKYSLVDYPGKVAAVVFTQGCNFRCPYCHNQGLLKSKVSSSRLLDQGLVLEFLYKRQKQLDGVVITGGEPTLQPDLVDFIDTIKSLGYLVKLDTNGSRPEILNELVTANLVDYIAMDIKAPLEKYDRVAGVPVDIGKIEKSIAICQESGLKVEFRVTTGESIHDKNDIELIRSLVPQYQLLSFQSVISV